MSKLLNPLLVPMVTVETRAGKPARASGTSDVFWPDITVRKPTRLKDYLEVRLRKPRPVRRCLQRVPVESVADENVALES